ncbi:MAG: chemotaxis protein CheX [Desulfobulbaceae bacterium]|nr:chemotaxis protein CheX [Desulfobulbaceae bacterium]MCK5323548.1 chemotaxis protein CheX [Desulfobulbaceae bacterium]
MKAEFINPFLAAAKNVLETMAQTKVNAGKPLLKEEPVTYGEITGIIGMASDKIEGTMVISFEKSCILKIVGNMLYEPPKSEIDDEIVDAVGELTNMICGGAKAELAKLNQKFDLATPTMVVGTGVAITVFSDAPTLIIPFDTENGKFVIEANLMEK